MGLSYELDVFARTLWAEARGESFAGQVAVAWVIKNRTLDRKRRWPRTISGVCLQARQFSCWNEGDVNLEKLKAVTLDAESFVRAQGVAALVMGSFLFDNTKGANHYLTPEAAGRVRWDDGMQETARIGGHVFYRG